MRAEPERAGVAVVLFQPVRPFTPRALLLGSAPGRAHLWKSGDVEQGVKEDAPRNIAETLLFLGLCVLPGAHIALHLKEVVGREPTLKHTVQGLALQFVEVW